MIDTREHTWLRAPEPGTYRIVPLRQARMLKYCCHKCKSVSPLKEGRVGRHGIIRGFVCPSCSVKVDLQLRGWEVYDLKKSDWPGGFGVPGTWRVDENKNIWLCCPKCKKIARLEDSGHKVDAQGIVTPSVGCPSTPRKPCDFHHMVRLLDYA